MNNTPHATDEDVTRVLGRTYTIRLLTGRMFVSGRETDSVMHQDRAEIQVIDPGDAEQLADRVACAVVVAFRIERERKVKARRAARARRALARVPAREERRQS